MVSAISDTTVAIFGVLCLFISLTAVATYPDERPPWFFHALILTLSVAGAVLIIGSLGP